MEQISDDDLVRLYRDGDAEAFDTLFDRHYVSVYNFARTMLGNAGGPEEVLQEVFLTVAQGAAQYTPQGRFRPWLMRIVRNQCLNRLRAERLRRATVAQSRLEFVDPAADQPDPSETVDADERAAIVRQAVAELPDKQREAIALYAFEHMMYREIAEVTQTPINTVKTLILRARAGLAEKLARFHPRNEHGL